MTKKVIIPFADIPPAKLYYPNSLEVRYRVTAFNLNRVSAWTPILTVDAPFRYVIDGDVNAVEIIGDTGRNIATITWPDVEVWLEDDIIGTLPEVDIWTVFHDEEWEDPNTLTGWHYVGRIRGNSVSIDIPEWPFYEFLYVQLRRPSYPIDPLYDDYNFTIASAEFRLSLPDYQPTSTSSE